jgi:hypothetical protein
LALPIPAEPVVVGSRSIPMPLTEPSVQAAIDFLGWIVPPGVFSAGSGRRRRRGESSLPPGGRSNQGFLVMYCRPEGAEIPRMVAFKSRASISRYLEQELAREAADHWVCTQITQYRARRDGKPVTTFTTAGARHILGMVADLDGHRMEPEYRRLFQEDWWGFITALEAHLDGLGVESYRIVRSGPEGLHVYLPLIRNDGLPLRASEKTLMDWERAAKGVCRYLTAFGADTNAVRAVQPFAIPGMPRAKYPGFIPHVVLGRDGARANLYALTRRLSELNMLMQTKPLAVVCAPATTTSDVTALLEEIRTQASGVKQGDRNQAAHDIAVYLLCKGARSEAAWEALKDWNDRNSPPLPERELRRCLDSAEQCQYNHPQKWGEMQRAAWFRLRSLLDLPAVKRAGYMANGRWRPLTPRKSWEERKYGGGREHYEEVAERVLRFVAGHGGSVERTQAEIVNVIDTNVSTLKAVLKYLMTAGKLTVATKRGRGGTTTLTLPASLEPVVGQVTENGQCGFSSGVAKKGVWVGSRGLEPLMGVEGVFEAFFGVSLQRVCGSLAVTAVDESTVVLCARDWVGRDLLWALKAADLMGAVSCRLGRMVLVDEGMGVDLDPGG